MVHEPPAPADPMTGRSAEPWPGVARLDGGATPPLAAGAYRALTLEQTHQRVWPRRHRIGVTRVADVTDLDYLGIPVAVATRAGARRGQNTSCQGAGPTFEAALTGALMEAVERHSASRELPLILSSAPSLRSEGRAHAPLERLGAVASDAPIEWIASRSLRTGRDVLLPAAEVLFPYTPPPGVLRPVRPSTSGLAAGNSLAEAALHALFEVIERDAVSRFTDGFACPPLDPGSVEGPDERRLLDVLAGAGIEALIVDLSGCSVLPAFKIYAVDTASPQAHLAVAGQGAHLSPAVALRRALYEVVQSRAVAIQGSREDLERRREGWSDDYDAVLTRFRMLEAYVGRRAPTRLGAPSDVGPRDLSALLGEVCGRLERAGHDDVLCTDLTDPAVGIAAVHVCVPGLVDSVVEPGRRRHAPEPR